MARFVLLICALAWASLLAGASQRLAPSALVTRYCLDCHDQESSKGDFNLDLILEQDPVRHAEQWEKVIRRMQARQMPPEGKPRPSESEYNALISALAVPLDQSAARQPNPGRTDTLRRLNRTEYQNAIRDLLDLEIDAAALLPGDESSHGFDNVTVANLSPTLLDRYITAAQKISRLALGSEVDTGSSETFRLPADRTQEHHVPGLPAGTRGGALIPFTFPADGEYEIQIRLTRDRNEEVEGLREPHELVVLLDREQVHTFTLQPPKAPTDHQIADQHLTARIPVRAGPHQLGLTFPRKGSSLIETRRQPYAAHYNLHRHPRLTPAIFQVTINGPMNPEGPGDTPSRRRVLVCQPSGTADEEICAREIVSKLARRAYRRSVAGADLERLMEFYRAGQAEGSFESGIEMALSAILVSPQFLFRIENDPPEVAARTAYRISDLELASRLSFFLWSSIPDDALLEAALEGKLSQPAVLEKEVRRMLTDPRSRSLAANFAGQWLHLRNLDSVHPDLRLFPDFDDNLRQAFREETERLFETVLREDRSVLDLLKADFTHLNERLARHYGIPHVHGTHFRRVPLPPESERGGLLRHGSILTVTSYATRTSPVLRGNWILANILGTPPPPPPADVPTLTENTVSATLSVRARLAEHRANPACASCHNLMDPVGFALENFDAVGRWRVLEEELPVDAAGGLPDGSRFTGVSGLEESLLARPELFAGTLAEKLLTFALGRGIEPSDAPAVRQIVHTAREAQFNFSSLILGVVQSTPFQMRNSL